MLETENTIYLIQTNEGESNSYSYDRDLFIHLCKPKTDEELNYYLKYANIYCNIKYYKSKYNEKIMFNLNNLLKHKHITKLI